MASSPLGPSRCVVWWCVSVVYWTVCSFYKLPCYHITCTLFPCPSPLRTLLVPPLTSNPSWLWLSRVAQPASSNSNCSSSTLASVVPLEHYTRAPLQKGVTHLYKFKIISQRSPLVDPPAPQSLMAHLCRSPLALNCVKARGVGGQFNW